MIKTVLLLFALCFTCSMTAGCSKKMTGPTESINSQTCETSISSIYNSDERLLTFLLFPTDKNVAEFETLVGDFQTGYEDDTCYNVTPSAFLEKHDFQIFKYESSCEAFLLYEGQIYTLGTGFGGYGVTSFAVSDIDADGNNELYFTFSWGSGIHRSQIGYFDFGKKATTIFNYASFDEEIVISVDNENNIGIYTSVLPVDITSFVHIDLRPETKISDIVLDSDEITLECLS